MLLKPRRSRTSDFGFEASLPALCVRGLAGPNGLVRELLTSTISPVILALFCCVISCILWKAAAVCFRRCCVVAIEMWRHWFFTLILQRNEVAKAVPLGNLVFRTCADEGWCHGTHQAHPLSGFFVQQNRGSSRTRASSLKSLCLARRSCTFDIDIFWRLEISLTFWLFSLTLFLMFSFSFWESKFSCWALRFELSEAPRFRQNSAPFRQDGVRSMTLQDCVVAAMKALTQMLALMCKVWRLVW